MRAAMGSIQRLGKDHYRVSMEGSPNKDGKRTRKTKVVRGTRQDAEVVLARMRLDADKEPNKADSWCFSAYWDAVYAPTLNQKGKDTARGIQGAYKRNLAPLFGEMKMSEITKRVIENRLATVENDHARLAAFKAMRQAFNYGWESELLSENPFLRKPKVKAPRKTEQQVMDSSQLSEWYAGITGFRFEPALILMAACGLRRGEACALRWDDVAFAEEEGYTFAFARVERTSKDEGMDDTKTERSTRTVVCSGYPAVRLKELAGEGWLCRSESGGMVKPHFVYASYKAWCRKHGVEYIPMRNLRTTYATLQQANNVDALIVSRALGHTKLSMDYAHYFMANKPSQMAAAKAMADSLVTFCNTENEMRESG